MDYSSNPSAVSYEIKILPISTLYPHEETLESILEPLTEKILHDQVFTEPVLVSKDTYVILDGHHRWNALKKLGFKKIPCLVLDYMDPSIKVGTWYPVVMKPAIEVFQVLQEQGIQMEELNDVHKNEIEQYCQSRISGALICLGEKLYKVHEERNRVHRIIRKHFLQALNYFDNWQQACDFAQTNNYVCIISYAFTKEEIIEFAHNNILLPPKATRHILPVIRPKIQVPLEELR